MTSFDDYCPAGRFEALDEAACPPVADELTKSEALTAKRLFDIVGAVAAIVFFAPILITIYLALKLSSGKPLFLHLRVGKNGAPFYCYKFRSMVKNADQVLIEHLNNNPAAREEWNQTFKLARDPRITWYGSFLRLTSLDELPQFFNVLKGDMSLVGPRPIVQDEVALYGDKIAAYYSCRPGITGLWQVSGRNLVTYDRRVELDAIYAARQSLRFDFEILLRTVLVVVSRRGAL